MTNMDAYRNCMKHAADSMRQLEKALEKHNPDMIAFYTIAITRERHSAIYFKERAMRENT